MDDRSCIESKGIDYQCVPYKSEILTVGDLPVGLATCEKLGALNLQQHANEMRITAPMPE